MPLIQSMKCIYDTARQSWAIELAFDEKPGTHRFPISADQVEPFLEAFDDCSKAEFDPSSREVVFAYEYEEEDEDEKDEESEKDEKTRGGSSGKGGKAKAGKARAPVRGGRG